MRLYRRRLLRGFLAIAIIAGLAIAIISIALPFAVSTAAVRDRLERDISEWTGHEVQLLERPKIGFWPVPHIKLNRISISSRNFPDAHPIVFANEMKAEFSVLSALRGAPSFSNFLLVRPVFTVEIFSGGTTSWNSDAGRISEGMITSVENLAASADESRSPQPIPAHQLGEVTVEKGTFTLIDHTTGKEEKITALNGTIAWPRLNGSVQADINGIYRGEAASVSMSSSEPLLLLAQKIAQLKVDLVSDPIRISFDGTATVAKDLFAAGTLSMVSPSMRQTLLWAGTEIKPGEAIGALSLDAEVQLKDGRAMFDKLILELEGNRGIGVLDFKQSEDDRPGISGTIAFNSLDISSFMRAFTPLPRNGEEIAKTIDTSFLNQLTLDMRLSAQSATLGPLTLTNVAAAARIDQGRAMFDIGDATAYGGSLLGRISLAESGIEGAGEIRFSAKDINLEDALAALKIEGPFPQGTATLQMAVSTKYPTWATSLNDLDGNLELSIVNGFVPSFDIVQFRELAANERFFGLGGISSGSFQFDTAEFQATLSNGLAEINMGEIKGPAAWLDLTGIIPYQRGGLALVGHLKDVPVTNEAQTDAPEDSEAVKAEDHSIAFFVGGSWPAPVISPILGN